MGGFEDQQWLVLLIAGALAGNRLLVAYMTYRQLNRIADSGQSIEAADNARVERQFGLCRLVAAIWFGVGVGAATVADWPMRIGAGLLIAAASWWLLGFLFDHWGRKFARPAVTATAEVASESE